VIFIGMTDMERRRCPPCSSRHSSAVGAPRSHRAMAFVRGAGCSAPWRRCWPSVWPFSGP